MNRGLTMLLVEMLEIPYIVQTLAFWTRDVHLQANLAAPSTSKLSLSPEERAAQNWQFCANNVDKLQLV